MNLSEIKLVLRKITKGKTFAAINIIGLSIGILCSVIAFLYVQHELKYDKHFTNTENVYRITSNHSPQKRFYVTQPPLFLDEVLNDLPDVQSGLRILGDQSIVKVVETNYVDNESIYYVDSNFFSFLGWELLMGNRENIFESATSVIISEKKSKQFFGEENPIGKVLNIDNRSDFVISGVFKDIPEHSHLKTDFVVPFKLLRNHGGYRNWGWHSCITYLKIHEDAAIEPLNNKLTNLWNAKCEDTYCIGDFVKFKLQPYTDIYLKSGYLQQGPSNMAYMLGFVIIAIFILVVSCFNFINLSIANYSKNTTETGIKKVLGAGLKVFSRQIFLEVSLYLVFAVIISSLIIELILPHVNSLINKDMEFSFINNPFVILFIILLCFVILCGTAVFPLMQVLSVNTSGILKGAIFNSLGKKQKAVKQGTFRNALVVTQFVIGIMLILSSIIINKQLNLIRKRDAGFDKEQMLALDNNTGNSRGRYNKLKNILKNYPEIKSFSSASHIPVFNLSNWGRATEVGNENNVTQYCAYVSVNDNYFKTIGAEIVKGRDFDESKTTDKEKIIINEALQKELALENPIGTWLTNFWDNDSREIIGVVKNIEYSSIHYKTHPTVFFCKNSNHGDFYEAIIMKLQSEDLSQTLALINDEWDKVAPNIPIDYAFLDQQFAKNYQKETQTAKLMNIMTLITIFLCCLGLFGLALFSINRQIKDIGVRKVNGARTYEIIMMLNKDFMVLIGMAYLIAVPLSILITVGWLNNFAHKTSIDLWVFVATGFSALLIAVLTISWHSWRAAIKNPVEALRYE